ncbi:MAG: FKBP-type peptidyl-prolyl cis-trans isomerase [Bacteroidia bacterium]
MKLFFLSAVLMFAQACNNNATDEKINPADTLSQVEVNTKLINSNTMFAVQERDEIQEYIHHHHYNMQATASGIYYWIYQKGNGEQAKAGETAVVKFTISLLDGTLCYSSDKEGLKSFLIGKDQVETGLHEAVQLMHVGDKAVFILPSNLAAGMVGDREKIPPKASVVYDLELVSLK